MDGPKPRTAPADATKTRVGSPIERALSAPRPSVTPQARDATSTITPPFANLGQPIFAQVPTHLPGPEELRRRYKGGWSEHPMTNSQTASLLRARADFEPTNPMLATLLDLFVTPKAGNALRNHAAAQIDEMRDDALLMQRAAVLDNNRYLDGPPVGGLLSSMDGHNGLHDQFVRSQRVWQAHERGTPWALWDQVDVAQDSALKARRIALENRVRYDPYTP